MKECLLQNPVLYWETSTGKNNQTVLLVPSWRQLPLGESVVHFRASKVICRPVSTEQQPVGGCQSDSAQSCLVEARPLLTNWVKHTQPDDVVTVQGWQVSSTPMAFTILN